MEIIVAKYRDDVFLGILMEMLPVRYVKLLNCVIFRQSASDSHKENSTEVAAAWASEERAVPVLRSFSFSSHYS